VNLKDYLLVGGEPAHDAARDAEYTRELGERIASSFRADTHVISTHLVAFALFRGLAKQSRTEELFRIIRGPEESPEPLPTAEVARRRGTQVTLWSRRHETAEGGVGIPSGVHRAASLAEAAKAARTIFFCVPVQHARALLRSLGDVVDGGHLLVHAARGLESP